VSEAVAGIYSVVGTAAFDQWEKNVAAWRLANQRGEATRGMDGSITTNLVPPRLKQLVMDQKAGT
jgi:hypothetical protein